MASGSGIGMMEGAFFVGRREILQFFNDLLQLNLAKVEETHSGAVACQVCDILYGVPMQKVKWPAAGRALAYGDMEKNYKVLQSCFVRNKIDKHIPVEALMRGKYQDNLEFMQWLKRFYEVNQHAAKEGYDPVARRAARGGKAGARRPASKVKPAAASKAAKGGAAAGAAKGAAGPAAATGRAPKAAARPAARRSEKENRPRRPAGKAAKGGARGGAGARGAGAAGSGSGGAGGAEVAALKARVAELEKSTAAYQAEQEGTRRECDFYFGKLREVEIMLENYDGPDATMADKIKAVLYATEEGFEAAADDEADAAAAPQIEAGREEAPAPVEA